MFLLTKKDAYFSYVVFTSVGRQVRYGHIEGQMDQCCLGPVRPSDQVQVTAALVSNDWKERHLSQPARFG